MLLDSYRHWIGHDLMKRTADAKQQACTLFEASVVVVSHGVEPAPPVVAPTSWPFVVPLRGPSCSRRLFVALSPAFVALSRDLRPPPPRR
ncbi:MAG: MEKHLA domain-containing protein [Planctomycetes bacterium]|nr:MEKHLA domain-containing protein [Planctomycetota bacterium]